MMWGPAGAAAMLLGLIANLLFFPTPADGPDFWIPMTFIIVGVFLFLWEVSMPGFFIAVPATVSVVLGIIGMFVPTLLTSPFVIVIGVAIAAPVTFVTFRVYRNFAPPDAAPTTTTGESLVGRQGTVTVQVEAETTRGKVRISGQVWSARTEGAPIPVGNKVAVVKTVGVHVLVEPLKAAGTAPAEREPSKPAHSEPTHGDPPEDPDHRPSDAPSESRP